MADAQPTGREPDSEPKLLAAWLAVLQAELMWGHLAASGASWPQANLYLHACITAMRSVTFVMQRALRHKPGFKDWYQEIQQQLAADPEFVFLRDARNYVLKEGALELMMSHSISYNGRLHMELRGIGSVA